MTFVQDEAFPTLWRDPERGDFWARPDMTAADVEAAWQQLASPPPVDLRSYAADKRWRVETGGIVVNGVSVNTSRDSQAMINGAVVYLDKNPDATSVNFKAATGWMTLDKATMLAIGIAVGAHVQACFDAEKDIDDDITSGAITTTAQIDGDSRWPGNQ